jgi:hypothetical protein
MNWAKAIATNQAALIRIVAALIAMAGLNGDGVVGRLKRSTYREVLRLLRPAEAAVRRLIVIAARGLNAKLPPRRPFPQGLALTGARGGRPSFQLFDGRERFGWAPPKRASAEAGAPRILIYDSSPLVPLFRCRPVASAAPEPKPEPDGTVATLRLSLRLQAIKRALQDLPGQARRLARWQAKRAGTAGFKSASPLRRGRPPGHRKEPRDEIDWILREVHALARDALAADTS